MTTTSKARITRRERASGPYVIVENADFEHCVMDVKTGGKSQFYEDMKDAVVVCAWLEDRSRGYPLTAAMIELRTEVPTC